MVPFSSLSPTHLFLRHAQPTVPASSEKMLRKSLDTTSDVIVYDLEDSVSPAPADKVSARDRLMNFFSVSPWQRRL